MKKKYKKKTKATKNDIKLINSILKTHFPLQIPPPAGGKKTKKKNKKKRTLTKTKS
jgi:hypothetical protein